MDRESNQGIQARNDDSPTRETEKRFLTPYSAAWGFGLDHPYASGALIGVIGTAAAVTDVEAVAAFGAASYPGVGTAYAAKQIFAGTVYSTLTAGTLGSIPGTLTNFSQVNRNNPSTFLRSAGSLTLNVGPTFAGGYVSALGDIYQLLSQINQTLTSIIQSSKKTDEKKK